MTIARSTLIGTAVAVALLGRAGAIHAQQASGDQSASNTPSSLQEVTVSGIRFSLEQSIQQKRDASNVVDVITAEDIGKLPDKNVADALQRLPGVTISAAGANEGGFDEADRVSMRGTNPSLTLTLINGHSVASGDWFVLDQTGTVPRSVSYTLMPAEIVGRVVVNKSSEADFVEGGVAGTVDIITRRPLDFKESTTLQALAGAVYADLPSQVDPQFNALGNFINDSRTFGVLLQVFAENRHLERQGQELLGYSQILPTSPLAATHPDLANVYYPDLIGSTLFQQKRERTGGMVDIQWAPNDQVDIDLSGFNSKLDATDLNTNYLLFNSNVINGGAGQTPTVPAGSTLAQVCAANPGKYNGCAPGLGLEPGYLVQGSTLTRAAFTPYSATSYGVYDQISRPDEGASTNFINLDAHLKASEQLSFLGQLGLTTGHSRTPEQDVSETLPGFGNGAAYQLNGTATAANWNLGANTLNTTPTPNGVPVPFSFIFGDQNVDTVDREVYGKIDGVFRADAGLFKDLKFGARYTDHERNLWGVIGQGPTAFGSNPLNYPTGFQNYPRNFGNGLGAGFPTGIWYWTPEQLFAYNLQGANRNPITRADWTSDYGLEEKDTAGYVQADFGGTGWSGNIGVRAVQTKERVIQNVAASPTNPNAITTSAFGPYVQQTTSNTYTDVLPTANLKLDVTHDLVARFAAGQTMARPDWSALANSIALGAPPPRDATVPGSATGSNPNLKPIKSTNVDAGLEWYYAPRALLAGTAFYMDLKNYVAYGSYLQYFTQFDKLGAYQAPYLVTAPVNADGRVYGAEFQWQQPFGDHFGIQTNYTYANGKQTSAVAPGGTDQLLGTSKTTYNVIGWFETSRYFARVAYTYRSAFYSGLDRSTAFSQDAFGTLGASLGYTVNDNFQITLDGLNLNNPTYKYFALNEYQPRAFYKNGSQYYLNFRFKL